MLLIPVLATAPTSAQQTDAGWLKESKQWLESVEPDGRVRVVNSLGDIHARFGGYEPRVEILATIQYRKDRGEPPRVELSPTASGLEVTTRSASVDEGASAPGSPGRVDLVIFVPRGVALDAETERDHIHVKGLESDVTANSLGGDIHVRSVRGAVQAKTVRGAISAALETGVTDRRQTFFTETGEIEIYLWEDANMQVRIATSGEISTDFSIEIEHRRFEEPGKLATATVGRGGSELELRSKRGRIGLLRLQKDFHPD